MPILPPRRGLFPGPDKKRRRCSALHQRPEDIFSYAWLKPLPKTSVVLSMDMKAFRCSL